jgi:hypothetical protein
MRLFPIKMLIFGFVGMTYMAAAAPPDRVGSKPESRDRSRGAAETRDDVREKISRLARRVELEVMDSDASDSELNQVKTSLAETLDLLRGVTRPDNYKACVDFAYALYFKNLNSSQAQEKAIAACKKVGSFEALQILYKWHFENLNETQSMDLAASQATRMLRGKMEILKFVYAKYFEVLNASQSATRASEKTAEVSKDSLDCIKKAYTRHFESLNARESMDAAMANCKD